LSYIRTGELGGTGQVIGRPSLGRRSRPLEFETFAAGIRLKTGQDSTGIANLEPKAQRARMITKHKPYHVNINNFTTEFVPQSVGKEEASSTAINFSIIYKPFKYPFPQNFPTSK
jgi:hypothetical protein